MGNENIFADFIIEEETETKPLQTDLFGFETTQTLITSGKLQSEDEKNKSRSQDSENINEVLRDKAKESSYKKTVHDQEIKSIKLQREKIQLMKDAEEVGEISFFDFCFVSYMEKMNVDGFKMLNRIEARILTLSAENKGSVIMAMLKKEYSNVIKSVKIAQANEVKRWHTG